MKKTHPLIRFFFYTGYIFLYAPIILIMVYSFNVSHTIQWQGTSLRWYEQLFSHSELWSGVHNSLKIAILSATFSVILGTACAALVAHDRKKNLWLGFLASMPLVIPELVTGLSLLMVFVRMEEWCGWPQKGLLTVVFAHTLLGASYVYAITRSRFVTMDPALSEAALDLGAHPYKVFFLIKLPLIMPALMASWLIVFMISFDDVILASFTTGPGVMTLPLIIFSQLKVGYTPQINALATCIIVMISFLIMAIGYIAYRKDAP